MSKLLLVFFLSASVISLSSDFFALLYHRAVLDWGSDPIAIVKLIPMGGCLPGYEAGVNFSPTTTPLVFMYTDGSILTIDAEGRTIIVLNQSCNWMGGDKAIATAAQVITHELGHSFFPSGYHSSDPDSVMWPYVETFIVPDGAQKFPFQAKTITNWDRRYKLLRELHATIASNRQPAYVFGLNVLPVIDYALPRWMPGDVTLINADWHLLNWSMHVR